MKFTYPQKKWVLTTALLAVLGCNISFQSHTDGVASADFASTSGDLKESKVYTAQGAIPVKYMDSGDKEVLAIIPRRTTEGKICEDNCGLETITLSVKNKEDIDALNIELMKALEKSKTSSKKAREEVAEADASEESTEEVVAEKPKKNHFDRVVRDCRNTEDADALKCYVDGYLAVLKDPKKAKDVSVQDAGAFYKREVQSRLVKELSEARRLSSKKRRAQVDAYAWQSYMNSEDFDKSPTDILQHSLYVIEDLIREMPSKYEIIRSNVISAQTEVLKFEAAQIKATNQQAESQKGTAEGLYLTQEATYKIAETDALRQAMSSVTNSALLEARSNGSINDDQVSAYQKFFQEFNNQLVAALTGQNSTLTNGVQANPAIDLTPRLQTPGRGTGTIGTLPGQQPAPISQIGTLPPQSGVSTRTGATSLSAGSSISTPSTYTNQGVSFGNPSPASQQSLELRARIRGQ